MRTCIISGGMIEPDFAFPYLQKQQFDIILAADRGLEFCYHYQIIPTYILGDFDSLSPEILNYYKENHVAPIREFNPMKDNTDTDIAFQQAIVLGSSEITILGATGGRLDHFLSIVQNLKTAWEKKIPAYIVDSRNLITIPVETSFEVRKVRFVLPAGKGSRIHHPGGLRLPARPSLSAEYFGWSVREQ